MEQSDKIEFASSLEIDIKLCENCQINKMCKFYEAIQNLANRFIAGNHATKNDEIPLWASSIAQSCIEYRGEQNE